MKNDKIIDYTLQAEGKINEKKDLLHLVGQQSELLAIADMIYCHYTKLSRKINNQFWN